MGAPGRWPVTPSSPSRWWCWTSLHCCSPRASSGRRRLPFVLGWSVLCAAPVVLRRVAPWPAVRSGAGHPGRPGAARARRRPAEPDVPGADLLGGGTSGRCSRRSPPRCCSGCRSRRSTCSPRWTPGSTSARRTWCSTTCSPRCSPTRWVGRCGPGAPRCGRCGNGPGSPRRTNGRWPSRRWPTSGARIARELHDVVAHHVSVMGVLATGARRVLRRDLAAADEALATIEDTGRVALRELRRLLDVLRTDAEPAAELAPQPGLAGIDRAGRAGTRGGAAGHPGGRGTRCRLSSRASTLTVYRIVQEALTNALKHAGRADRDGPVRGWRTAVETMRSTARAGPAPAARPDRARAGRYAGTGRPSRRDPGRRATPRWRLPGARGSRWTGGRSRHRGSRTAAGPDDGSPASFAEDGARPSRHGAADPGAARRRSAAAAHRVPDGARRRGDLDIVGRGGGRRGGGRAARRAAARRGADGHPDAAAGRGGRDPARSSSRAPVRVLILTTFDLDEYVVGGAAGRGERLPAQGRAGRASWSPPIRTVAAGEALVAPRITRRLLDRFAAVLPDAGQRPRRRRWSTLTERERRCSSLVARGLSNAEIAARAGRSARRR